MRRNSAGTELTGFKSLNAGTTSVSSRRWQNRERKQRKSKLDTSCTDTQHLNPQGNAAQVLWPRVRPLEKVRIRDRYLGSTDEDVTAEVTGEILTGSRGRETRERAGSGRISIY